MWTSLRIELLERTMVYRAFVCRPIGKIKVVGREERILNMIEKDTSRLYICIHIHIYMYVCISNGQSVEKPFVCEKQRPRPYF